MPSIPGVNHLDAVRALEKAGFQIIRQGKHIVMWWRWYTIRHQRPPFQIVRQGKHIVMGDGIRQVSIPRHNPIQAFTMGGIARDAGLSVEEFRKLL